MKIEQKLSWYKRGYSEAEWEIKNSTHYNFYYLKNSLAEKNIDEIAGAKEKHYKKIISLLNVQNDRIIDYYLYPSLREKTELMGDNSPGNAVWQSFELVSGNPVTEKFEIHVVYNNTCKFIGEHEDTHLLSLSFGLSIYLFCEGLAQFVEGNLFGIDVDVLCREMLKENKLYSVSELVDNKYWGCVEPPIIYPQVGSFSRFLISNYGWNKYIEVYKQTSRLKTPKENMEMIKSIFQDSIFKIEKNWIEYLSNRR